MEFLEQIKAELKKQGMPETLANVIIALSKVEAEADITAVVTKFKAEAYPAIKAEADSVASKGIQTAIVNYEKKHKLKDGKPATEEPEKPVNPPTDQLPEWVKTVFEKQNTQIETLTKTIQGIVQTQTASQKLAQAKQFITTTQIPVKLHEKWAKKIDVNSDVSVEDQIKALEADYLDDRQIDIDIAVGSGDFIPKPHKELSMDEYKSLMNGNAGSDPTTVSLGLTAKN